MKMLVKYFMLLMLGIVIVGCSGSQKLMTETETSSEEDQNTGIINEFFDPLILDEEELKIKKTISVDSKSDQMGKEISKSTSSIPKSDVASGFRVQICAVSDEERARQIHREAILKFMNEEVYLIYDSPYYKVRVGNCLTRYEADQLQQLAVEKGFQDAWVVRTNIKVKSVEDSPRYVPNQPPN